MKFALRILAALVGLSSVFASAKVATFTADNFSVTVPDGWSTPPYSPMPAGSRLVMAGQNPADHHAYYIIVSGALTHGDAEGFLKGVKEPSIKLGRAVSETRDETINGVPFALFDVSQTPTEKPLQLIANAFTKDAVYTVGIIVPSGNINDAKELQGILHSFQFLTPVATLDPHQKLSTRSEEISKIVGQYLGWLFVGGIVLAIYFRSVKKKQQR